ncbi:hypothetical protein H1D32_22775 [Anaerobacillus sp. CMMVII]|uniref:hypothetical protein n=1 Tax=Anaerobacillus sp. CMMVII TaxID=2755588 RepID=UPI0021B7BB0C|nr:hypothetical protein [Anaerobacillus sp. CMMVII]MCT8140273.1 hypothetical protein [Anaerobacillus sp. CMMVII]
MKKKETHEKIYQEMLKVVKEIIAEGDYPTEGKIKRRVSFPIYYKELYAARDKVFTRLNISKNNSK